MPHGSGWMQRKTGMGCSSEPRSVRTCRTSNARKTRDATVKREIQRSLRNDTAHGTPPHLTAPLVLQATFVVSGAPPQPHEDSVTLTTPVVGADTGVSTVHFFGA